LGRRWSEKAKRRRFCGTSFPKTSVLRNEPNFLVLGRLAVDGAFCKNEPSLKYANGERARFSQRTQVDISDEGRRKSVFCGTRFFAVVLFEMKKAKFRISTPAGPPRRKIGSPRETTGVPGRLANIQFSRNRGPKLRTPCGEERLARTPGSIFDDCRKSGSNIACGCVARGGVIRGKTGKCLRFQRDTARK